MLFFFLYSEQILFCCDKETLISYISISFYIMKSTSYPDGSIFPYNYYWTVMYNNYSINPERMRIIYNCIIFRILNSISKNIESTQWLFFKHIKKNPHTYSTASILPKFIFIANRLISCSNHIKFSILSTEKSVFACESQCYQMYSK